MFLGLKSAAAEVNYEPKVIRPYIALAIALYSASKDDQAIACCILEDRHLVLRHVNLIFCPIRIRMHVKDYSVQLVEPVSFKSI